MTTRRSTLHLCSRRGCSVARARHTLLGRSVRHARQARAQGAQVPAVLPHVSRLSRAIQGTLADPNPPGQRLDSASRKRAAAAADGGTLRVSPDPADAFAPRRLAHLDSYSTSSPLETRDIPAPARPRGPRLTPRPTVRHPPGALRHNFLRDVADSGDPKDVLAKYLAPQNSSPPVRAARAPRHGPRVQRSVLAARRWQVEADRYAREGF